MHNQLTTLTAPLTFTLVHPEPLHQLQSISSASEDQWMIALVRILPCRSMTWSQSSAADLWCLCHFSRTDDVQYRALQNICVMFESSKTDA